MKSARIAKRVGLGAVIAVILLLVLLYLGLAFGWVEVTSEEPSSDTFGMPVTDGEEADDWPFEGFPIEGYSSFEEAEQVAGYHVPRPSPEYPASFGRTHLRWFPQFERPLSETHYSYPPDPSSFIYVLVRPSYFSNDPTKLRSGRPMTVGGKSGWMLPDEDDYKLDYPCGEVDGYEVWCNVSASKDIGWEAFEHFVSTLE